MTMFRRALATGGSAAVMIALLSVPAHAQATRTWVSGVGDDVNPCSRTAPCKTFAGAISKTAAGGVISVLDPGGFGGLTITKSITIDGAGVPTSLLVGGTNGVIVNAGVTGDVVLRNLDIVGVDSDPNTCLSTNGVQVVNARSLRLDDVSISGFQRAVNTPLTGSSADLFVDLSFHGVDVFNNCDYGLRIAPDAGHQARATVDGSVVTGSNIALSVGAGAEAWVSNTKLNLNNVGVQSDGGPVHSLCGNTLVGNASAGVFTDAAGCASPVPAAPAAPAPPATPAAAPVYCSVPSLKNKTVPQARAALTKAGCRLGKVTKQKAASKKRKKVLTQTIPAAVQVRPGTAVAVRIGK